MTILLNRLDRSTPDRGPIARSDLSLSPADRPRRLPSIDLLRGLVMLLMALDHTRDFFGNSGMNPRDITEPALFMTRWITHFCAPIFIFLAGVSAYFYGAAGRSRGEVSRFLLTRGLFLIVMEFTIIKLAWTFSLDIGFFVGGVIWVIGASMVALAALIYLPSSALAAFALLMIAGHNLLDGVKAADFGAGALAWVWHFLHEPAAIKIGPSSVLLVLYVLIPWVGVMAAGYALGPVFTLEAGRRRRLLFMLGAAITLIFVLLRAGNLYGDPAPWTAQATTLATVLSFINCEKYPPSLLYLMMTLGPALILLAAFEVARGRLVDRVIIFGRVPFFFYVVHIYLIHILAVIFAFLTTGDIQWLLGGPPESKPADYGLSLPGIYLMTLLVIMILYPLCRWFAAKKQEGKNWWWSYV
jgi:uncharacterized membrane protein